MMNDWQLRVRDEAQEMETKIYRLARFIETNAAFLSLPIDDQFLMRAQLNAMHTYLELLKARIGRFT